MRQALVFWVGTVAFAFDVAAQGAVDVVRPEQQQKAERAIAKQKERRAKQTSLIEFRGNTAFKENELRTALKEEITTIQDFGLSPARADDLAFFLEVFYRKHGYAKVDVRYVIESSESLRLDITEGPQFIVRTVTFEGNAHESADKLFDYVIGPTRERYSALQKQYPFVAADLEEGARLVQRFYLAEGFLNVVVDQPRSDFQNQSNQVDVIVRIHEGHQYFFGRTSFIGQTAYGPDVLRAQVSDLLQQPYTDVRVQDIPRRLQEYFKRRGYYDVRVEANGAPDEAVNGRVPVEVSISTGPVYHFDGATVNGLQRLNPSFVTKRFTTLHGKIYSPDVLDARFRTLMKTGLFNVLQIKPVPVDGNLLRLEISAEEAKSKELGFWGGFDTYEGALAGVQVGDRDLFGTGRAGSATIEVSQRSYRGEILYEDPFFFDTNIFFRARASAFTFDYDGYSKFELGGHFDFTKQITKHDELGLAIAIRHVKITDSEIRPTFLLGPTTNYLVNTVGLTNTLDMRESPNVTPRGFLINNTVDLASSALGSDIEFIRSTMRVGYYLPLGPTAVSPAVIGVERSGTPLQHWFRQSSIAFGARAGVIHSLTSSASDEATALPIDERFFIGGATTVRSFGERDLGPHDNHGHPVGGEFYTVFNVEYTFPIFGELQGAIFTDAGNLLPSSEDVGLNDMRYAIGAGLRYKLPVGPLRLDYGVNPDPRDGEDFGAFHFSFGFAF
ncbi:MAG TPA: BamA/TamA family outer membrane protein [Candidatus Udaeobacter sp.]|jgi:outer membrane protein assembly complex protein YaeT|nr:BamA/TamA family outer membrane protein [Candidatus Udaeobacter sp.]